MRILIVPAAFPNPNNPNPSIWLLRQCQALVERGHVVRVAYAVPRALPFGPKWRAYRDIPSEYTYETIRVTVLRAFIPPRMRGLELVRLQIGRTLRTLAAQFRADLVHVNCLVPPGFLAIGVDKPIVLTAHGSDAYLYPAQRTDLRRAAMAAIKGATQVVAVSEFIQRKVEELGGHCVRVVPNGADPKVFSPQDRAAARSLLGLPPDKPVVVYAGTVERPKGLFDLAEAARSLTELDPSIVIAGQGPDIAAVRRAFERSGVRTTMAGLLSQARLAQVFAASDVVALPSYGEGLPTVLCEAMLAGRAVVATPVGGIPEIVRDNVTGLLIPVGDPNALAASLRRVLTDTQLRMRFENSAYEFATQHLTWSANVQAYEKIYAESLGQANKVL